MRNIDPVKFEIVKADLDFARDQICKGLTELRGASARLADAIDALSIEASLLAKDDPFCDDGTPCLSAMANFSACDEAMERIAELRLTRTK